MAAAVSYIILMPFRSYQVGNVYAIDPAVVALYPSNYVAVVNQTVVASGGSNTGTSTSGTSTSGTSTSGGSSGSGSSGNLTVGHAADGNLTLTDALGNVYELSSLSASQLAALMGAVQTGQILDAQGRLSVAVGAVDISAGIVAGMSAAALKAEADKAASDNISQAVSISTLGTASAAAAAELASLLNGTFSALSGQPTISGGVISFPHASGVTTTLTIPASSGTLAVPASAPLLYSDTAGVLHSGGVVATHIVSSNGTIDLSPSVLTSLQGVITGSSTSGNVTTLTEAGGAQIVITAPTGATGAAGSLAAGSLINPARESATIGGPSRLVSDILADSFTPEEFGATADGRSIQAVIGATTRYGVTNYANDAGSKPYANFATHPLTQSDDYCWWATDNSPTSGNTWDLSKQFTTTAAGFPSPANTDENYFYIPIDHGVYQSGGGIDDTKCNYHFFHYDMPITGGGLAAGTVVVSVMMTHLRVTAQPSGFSLPSGTVLTSCPDMAQFAVGKQVYCPQGLVPLSNITAVSGSVITLGSVTVPGTSSAPASVAQAQSTPFIACGVGRGTSGTGVQLNQQCIVYTPIAEANICAQTTMDHLAFWAADDFSRLNGNRKLRLGHAGYTIAPGIIATGGRLSMEGRGIASTSINSNPQNNNAGGASVFKIWPAPDAAIFITDINCGFYGSICRTFWDYDGRGFTSYGIYTGNTNNNAYALNQVNIGRVSMWRCHGHSNYAGGSGCLEFVRFEGMSYCQWNENLWEGSNNLVGSRGLTFGGAINIEMISNQVQNVEWAIEARSYCEHPILQRLLLQSCTGAFTNRRSDQFNIYSMFFGEFFGGDYAVSYRSYDIRDCDQVFINEYNGGGAANDNPGLVLHGVQTTHVNGGYANCAGSTTCGMRIASSVRDGNINGSVTVRVNDFDVDNAQHAMIVEFGSGQVTYEGVTVNGSTTNAVVDNTTYAGQVTNLNAGASAAALGLVFVGYIAQAVSFGTGGTAFPLYVAYDPLNTYSGTTWTCPATGYYDVDASVPVLGSGDSGYPGAGAAVALQFQPGTAVSAAQTRYVNNPINVASYRNIQQFNQGATLQLGLSTVSGTNSTKVIPGNGFVEIKRVA